ncbi:MAG TPA: hypothetical protein VHR72_07135 [Gemmataceae bacterium]|jgi:hypothetical protein|nr:hypothetical protein [Gemmataceae bacterium]
MSSKLRRYEVLLPVRLNDGSEVPRELIGDALNEIVARFDAVSFECEIVEGRWRSGGVIHRDDLSRIIVDISDTAANRKWMKAFKERWKERLDQLELWIVSYRIDVD